MRKLLILLTFPVLTSFAQGKCKKALIYSSAEVKSGKFKENTDVKHIHHALWSDSIVVRTKDQKQLYEPGKLWGYRGDDCTIYRIYDGDFYEISEMDTIIVYAQTINPFRDFPYTFYFFSKNLDSPVYKLTRENLEKEFGKNACFMAQMNQKINWFEDYSAVDRKKHIYKIVEIARNCNNK
jgi:hypothetical protein